MWVDAVTIEQIADTLRQLAARSPQPEKARQAAQTLLNEYAALNAEYAGKAKKRVFLQFGMNPLFTSGKGSLDSTSVLQKHNQSLDKYAFLRNSAFTHWVKEKCSKIC